MKNVKIWHTVPLSVSVFMIALLISASFVQAQTGLLRETRKLALVSILSRNQLPDGSFPSFMIPVNESMTNDHARPYVTAMDLSVLKMLNALDTADSGKALNYIYSTQNMTVGNSTLWGWPGLMDNIVNASDLYYPYTILNSLRLFNGSSLIDRQGLIQHVMARYNWSDGGFHEPTIRVQTASGEEEFDPCMFPLEFHADSDTAYACSNLISTFLGVSILADLDALSSINTTKTLEWVLSCKAENGVFKPFPTSTSENLPGWSSLLTNPFYVDSNGTGLAYTYAAVGTMKALEANVADLLDVARVEQYVVSCQYLYMNTTEFRAYPEDNSPAFFPSSFYALMTLHYIGALEKDAKLASTTVAYPLRYIQYWTLGFSDTWPIPSKVTEDYGLFYDLPAGPSTTTYFAVSMLNITGNLHLLDEPAPIVAATWTNLMELSTVTAASSLGFSVALLLTYRKIQAWKEKKPDLPRQIVGS